MVRSSRLWSFVLAGLLALGGADAAVADDAAQNGIGISISNQALDNAIHDYLTRHPEAVHDAEVAYQAKQLAKQQADAEQALKSEASKIYSNPASPVAGNPDGKEVMVEFFDYSCHYCKDLHPNLQALLKEDHELKVIFKDFPILGPGSALAAKAALAANFQGKYMALHDALLEYKGQFDDESLKQIAQDAGLDWDKLKTDMDDAKVTQALNDNLELAQKLNIHGTPTLIFKSSNQIVGGALPPDQLRKAVSDPNWSQHG